MAETYLFPKAAVNIGYPFTFEGRFIYKYGVRIKTGPILGNIYRLVYDRSYERLHYYWTSGSGRTYSGKINVESILPF